MAKKIDIKTKDIVRDSANHIPLRITDTTLRDAHQSLWATRMRTSDIMHIIDVIDNVGYYSLEVWGGARVTPSTPASVRSETASWCLAR